MEGAIAAQLLLRPRQLDRVAIPVRTITYVNHFPSSSSSSSSSSFGRRHGGNDARRRATIREHGTASIRETHANGQRGGRGRRRSAHVDACSADGMVQSRGRRRRCRWSEKLIRTDNEEAGADADLRTLTPARLMESGKVQFRGSRVGNVRSETSDRTRRSSSIKCSSAGRGARGRPGATTIRPPT